MWFGGVFRVEEAAKESNSLLHILSIEWGIVMSAANTVHDFRSQGIDSNLESCGN
jgi:hypothetical protein